MDFILFKTVIGKKSVTYHYCSKKVYLKLPHDSIKVKDLSEPDPDSPGKVRTVFKVYHKAPHESYPETIDIELKATKRLINYVCNDCYNIQLLLTELGSGSYELISKIISKETNKKFNEFINNPPTLIGFSIYNFNSRHLILVHDLSHNYKTKIIEVLTFRKSSKDHGLLSLHEFLYNVIIANINNFRDTVFVLPFNYEIYKVFNATTTESIMLDFHISALSMTECLANGESPFDCDHYIIDDFYDVYYKRMISHQQSINNAVSINKPSVFRNYVLFQK